MSKRINIELTQEQFERLGTLVTIGETILNSKVVEEYSEFRDGFEKFRQSNYEDVIGDLITCAEENEIEWANEGVLEEIQEIATHAINYYQVSHETAHYKEWKKNKEEAKHNRKPGFNEAPSPDVFKEKIERNWDEWLAQGDDL